MVAPHIRLSQSAEYRENYIVQENKLWCRFCNVEIDHERKNSIVEAFTYADIPLEKIEKLKPFLLNHCKNAGLITGANQLPKD
ncbi:hypothetical protein GLOIN_2v1563698 [Rhizophagus irregularis DAOM 181602=DAOM 197198]|nr:hypothetical protein GLOIN_2v1563698 [Rhizophagus irregularis DAOM 181602=DAOM 197198]